MDNWRHQILFHVLEYNIKFHANPFHCFYLTPDHSCDVKQCGSTSVCAFLSFLSLFRISDGGALIIKCLPYVVDIIL